MPLGSEMSWVLTGVCEMYSMEVSEGVSFRVPHHLLHNPLHRFPLELPVGVF